MNTNEFILINYNLGMKNAFIVQDEAKSGNLVFANYVAATNKAAKINATTYPSFEIFGLADVKQFFKWLLEEKISFHPDDDFKEYGLDWQAGELFNALMESCYIICEEHEVDIYELAMQCIEEVENA
jgi:hypothetical protein